MKVKFIAFLLVFFIFTCEIVALAQLKYTSQRDINVYTLSQVDSAIKAKPYTAIFYWSGWCGAQSVFADSVIEVLHKHEVISALCIFEPNTNDNISRKYIDKYATYKNISFCKLAFIAPERMISINDSRDTRLFNEHFSKHKIMDKRNPYNNRRIPVLYVLNDNGIVEYQSSTSTTVDSISVVLENVLK